MNAIVKTISLFSMMIFLITACQNSDDNTPGDTSGDITGGKWKVSYYWDKDKEETSDFAGYTFEFRTNGVFIATGGGQTVNGTWAVTDSNRKLQIDISGTKPLDDLNDDWLLLEKTNDSIKLKDDNTTYIEDLHFQRIP